MLNAKATCFLRRQSQAEDAENIRHAETGMRQRIAWIGGHGSFEPIQGDGQSVRQMKESPTPAQLVIIGRQVCRWPLAYLRDRGTVDLPWNRRRDGLHNFVLNGEQIGQISIISFGPDMIAGTGLDELRRNADAVPNLADTTFNYVP